MKNIHKKSFRIKYNYPSNWHGWFFYNNNNNNNEAWKKKKKIPIKISVTLRKPSTYRVYVFVLLIRVIGASLYFDSFV